MATIQLIRQKFTNKLVTPSKIQWRLAQKAIGTIDRDTLIQEAASHSRLSESELNSALNALCDSAAMFLGIGHGVQLGNLGTLSLSISSKAVDSEEECTADTLRGNVGVNLRAIGRLAKAIAEFKFRVSGVNVTEADPDSPEAAEAPGDNNTPQEGEQNQEQQAAVKYKVTWKHNGTVTREDELAEGENLVEPEAPEGYEWGSHPVTMPARDMIVTTTYLGDTEGL